ncbi:MAG: hypothetical protein L6V93_15525 [Clostridiales bacterium]|nr:MAG: hypothetical protein L6V93_15525 [Clostridiales bacterium]
MIYDRNYIPFVDCRSYILNKDDGNGKSVRYNVTKRYDERSLARHLVGYVDAKKTTARADLKSGFNSYLSGEGSYVFQFNRRRQQQQHKSFARNGEKRRRNAKGHTADA